ncbi:MAG: DUF3784 domain-containing protein [Lachnospiraceae bacterium]|nr:DUF3784 domain-containing protein [Lachnospiraceae bacterium]
MIYDTLIALIWILTIILLSGKGSFLIAGFNTAPEKVRKQYDKKKLSRGYGVGVGVIAVFITLSGILESDTILHLIPLVIILSVVLTTLYGTILCRKKPTETENADDGEITESESWDKGEKRVMRAFGIPLLVIVLLLLLIPFLYLGKVTVSYEEQGFSVKVSGWKEKKVLYEEIEDAELVTEFSVGSRTGGLATVKLLAGNFNNGALGAYELYAYKDSSEWLLLYREGKPLVIGFESAEETEELYEKILSEIQ